ncbi:MAG: acyl-CoA dehydrogenase family protein [Desulfobacterales bacterium]|nr:acyl-CoA dehydrogenase family protein [Desulfobacterales bacterium]
MNAQRSDPLAVIQWMLTRPATPDIAPQATLLDWQQRFDPAARQWIATLDRAMVGGFVADRLAWTLAAGYREALKCLVPGLPAGIPAALCVTESGGNHPRAIETRLDPLDHGWELNGAKTFITGADAARILVVAATTGKGDNGRPRLRMVRLPTDAHGVTVTAMPDLPFVPEIIHGTLALKHIRVKPEWVLPGDGYLTYIKPFRTIEDMHVMGAVMGYLTRTALAVPWPMALRSELFALMAALVGLSSTDPLDPLVHIVLGGLWSHLEGWVERTAPLWNETDPETRQRWIRDLPLLSVAQTARTRRLETAWQYFSVSK